MSEDKQIRFWGDEPFGRLARLASSTYSGREIADSDYLEWEYSANPDGNAIIAVEEERKNLNGQYLVLPRKYWDGKSILRGSLSVNTLTHPAVRGKGVFPRLAEKVYEECVKGKIDITLGFPNPASKPIFLSKLNFQSIGELDLYVKTINPIRAAFTVIFNRRNKSGEEIFSNNEEAHSSSVSRFSFQNDSELYQAFLKKFNSADRITTYRSPEFLKWRYMQVPIRRYSILKEKNENGITALAVIRMKYIYGLRCGIVTDLMTDGEADSGKKIISEIHRMSATDNLDLLIFAGSGNSREAKLVTQNGFRKMSSKLLPQSLTAILRVHNTEISAEDFPESKWFLTFGDYDIF